MGFGFPVCLVRPSQSSPVGPVGPVSSPGRRPVAPVALRFLLPCGSRCPVAPLLAYSIVLLRRVGTANNYEGIRRSQVLPNAYRYHSYRRPVTVIWSQGYIVHALGRATKVWLAPGLFLTTAPSYCVILPGNRQWLMGHRAAPAGIRPAHQHAQHRPNHRITSGRRLDGLPWAMGVGYSTAVGSVWGFPSAARKLLHDIRGTLQAPCPGYTRTA